MNTLLLASSIIFSIHAMPADDQGSAPEVPTMEKMLETAKKEMEEQALRQGVADVYIVTLEKGADLESVIERMERDTGGTVLHVYESIPGFAIEVPPSLGQSTLFYYDSVIDVEPDVILQPMESEEWERGEIQNSDALGGANSSQHFPNGVNRIGTGLSETAKINGIDDPLNVNIAIIDTGVDQNHPDLNVVFGKSFIRGVRSGYDDNGHGTHVAGTAAARDNGSGVVGVAPGARIYSLKVLNSSGWGYLSDIIEAVDWVTKESRTSYSSSSRSSAQRNYDRYMKRYRSYLDRAERYNSRIESYREKAEEYKKQAEENKWELDRSVARNVRKYERYHDRYMRRYDSYMKRADRYVSRIHSYQKRAEEYKRQAEEYLGTSESRYRSYMRRYESYLKRAERYVSRVESYRERAEGYRSQALHYKSMVEELTTGEPKYVLSRSYSRYIRRYESYMKRADRYVSRVEDYTARANEYKKKAESYLDDLDRTAAKNPDKIDVVNMSIGAIGVNRALHRAIQACVEQGVVVVVSAGNGGRDVFGPDGRLFTSDDIIPAAYPEAVTISAMADSDGESGGRGRTIAFNTPDDTMPGFSNHSRHSNSETPVSLTGGSVDFAAPGVEVLSTWIGGGYRVLHGTSMSAPHAAGAFALLIAKLGQDVNSDGRIDEEDVVILRKLMVETAQPQSEWRPGSTNDRDSLHEPLLQVSSF